MTKLLIVFCRGAMDGLNVVVPAGDAHLGDKDMVMAVLIGREARAYPIVQMSYHHILYDTVAEIPIVVTY